MIRKTAEVRLLDVPLTEEEYSLKTIGLAQSVEELRRMDEEEVVLKEGHKSKMEVLSKAMRETYAEVLRLGGEVRTRTTMRDTPCDWHFDFDDGKAILVRRDTGGVVQVRPIAEDEKQLALGDTVLRVSREVAEALKDFERQITAEDKPPTAEGSDV